MRTSPCGEVHIGRLFKAPKSRKGRRWVPLAAPAQDALDRHREAQLQEQMFFGVDYRDHGLVFCRPDGLPLRPDRVTVFRKYPFHEQDAILSFDPRTYEYEKDQGLLGETATG